MATRRKYKRADGGRADDPADVSDMAAAPAAGPVEAISDLVEENLLAAQLAAAQRAEEMQRQHAQQQPQTQALEEYIDALPDLSDHKRAFLKRFPQMLEPSISPLMARHYHEGRQFGLEDDGEQLDNYVLIHVARDLEHQRQLAVAQAQAAAPEIAQALQEPAATAETLEAEAARLWAEQQAAIPAPRRSIPMAAPVSRDIPMASGGRASHADNTLSRDEREIARVSFPHLPKAQAELAYLKNRRVMREMQADGRLPRDR